MLQNGAYRDRVDESLFGWTIGIGVEQANAANLIARLEHRYSDFGTNVYCSLLATDQTRSSTRPTMPGLVWRTNSE